MEESSESELTPSPKVQRRRLRVTRISSSSEDLKTESADSSGEDEEFLRKQIMDMRDDEQMSLSEDDKEKEAEDMVRAIVVDNAALVTKPSLPTSDKEGAVSMIKILPQTTTSVVQEAKETVLKKATPVMRQRQSTDEEVESITESLSKGSSSVQASSFTPGSSPTSASSIEEDSDSSPSRKKSKDKQHRKGKHRQPTQPLPTIEDSSEEERMKDDERSWKDKDEDVSSSEELRHVTVVSDKTSGSDLSASVDSVDRQALNRGRKPSPTVIPFTPEPVYQIMTKTLKSADEAYEEILQKAKAIPGESPPDIEPMFGGMPIEDYLYESLVEEPEKICKLQEAQILLEASAAAEEETCVVTMPTEEPSSPPLADADDEVFTDMQLKKKKRPAPPRPTEPPKRSDSAVIHSHPTGISFVRPMLPQDPLLAKALFPIPHLKITQCSSGEEEEDSLADEYGVGMSSDITPSDDSDAKEPSPPLSETAEMEPISIVCEIPVARPIPTPISAPELTSTPSPVSTISPPTSPGRGSPSSTGKKVKRTLPDPPPEDESLSARSGYSTNSARRRLARSTTMARAKILQDIDKELDLVERESSKLRKKQAELDEEEKEIDAKLRYLEMGINRRKEVLLQEREKRERAYLQGVAEERDYMSDSEVSNIREERGEGMERPRTTEADSQYNTLTSPYSHYAQYVPQTQTTSPYTQQGLYQQQSLYHQQVSPYQNVPTLSLSQAQPSSYQHALLLQQGKQRQTTLSDLEPKIATNYEVIRNQPLLIVPTSSESGYGVAPLGSKFASLDLRLGLEERSMASSPMSSISADSFYADIDHHNARNYVLIEDIGELTKASSGLGSVGFSLPDKELSKADRLLRAAEVRRTAEMADFLGSSRLQGYSKGEDDTMEEPYELKLLKQQIKQEFRRGTEGLEHLTGLGLPQYLHSDPTFRHFPKGEKYSIGRLTLEKQAAKQLPTAVLYQKQMKNKKAVLDPKAISKCSPIQESRDLEPDYASYMGSGASSVTNLAARARLLQDEITFGLRKNLAEQQKYLGSSLGANLAGSLNLGQSLGLGAALDGTYPSGSRSRPSSRPSSVYGLDLSIKRDQSSSSLRLKPEGDVLDAAFAPGVARTKPTSLPISQSRGRIPIVAQNSEEESPLSPVGQPMGMARASAGPLPPISADNRDQFGSSHSLPEVQQHMREESRTRGYDRDIAFIMDDLQGAMSDSEGKWRLRLLQQHRDYVDVLVMHANAHWSSDGLC
uniref:Piccolo presynaptic cytomatrix protein b n=1 Tax=Neogobius melanostomus TaxID=47308 RepID=A0A8C6SRL5_9GOBI